MIAGIVPGINGALAFVTAEGTLAALADMPLESAPGRFAPRPRVVLGEVASILRRHAPERAFVERLMPSPERGMRQTFAFGHTAGALAGVLAALNIRLTLTALDDAIAFYAAPEDREDARAIASRLWPETPLIQRTAHAEAALFALYGTKLRTPALSNVTAFRKVNFPHGVSAKT